MEKKNLLTHTRTAKPSTLRRRPLITRIALCAIPLAVVVAVVMIAFGSGAAPRHAHAAASFSTASIADIALRYDKQDGGAACRDANIPGAGPGAYDWWGDDEGGECRGFVGCVLYLASGGSVDPGSGYYDAYAAAGGKYISDASQVVKGDIIQLNNPHDLHGNTYYQEMHTSIIVDPHRNADGTFTVVDSNFVSHHQVGEHQWNPYSWAQAYGLVVNIWRFGTSTPSNSPIGMAATSDGQGYWIVSADGSISTFGDAVNYGSLKGQQLNAPIVGMTATPDGQGYWLVAADGGVFPYGDAPGLGSMGGQHLNAPMVGITASSDGQGYWLVAADGGIFPYGDAPGLGSMGGQHLNAPVVGMTATPDSQGYWLVAADGGIFPYGDAVGFGSMGGQHLNAPVVGMADTSDGKGYWLVAADGGIFPYGDASGLGSMGGQHLNAPVVGMTATPDSQGYWLVAADGGIFPYGDAPGLGSLA